jgi:hypothetical protein
MSRHIVTAHRPKQRGVAPGLAPMQALPPAPTGLKPLRPLSPPHHLLRVLPPRLRVLPPLTRAVEPTVAPAIEASLNSEHDH